MPQIFAIRRADGPSRRRLDIRRARRVIVWPRAIEVFALAAALVGVAAFVVLG